MTLSALIKKGGLTGSITVTPATTATHKTEQPVIVASVATVAVTGGTEQLSELLPNEKATILAWLAHIEERDPIIISEVMESCRDNLKTRHYFLQRSKEVPNAN